MPTVRPRYAITETDEIREALRVAAERWPEDKENPRAAPALSRGGGDRPTSRRPGPRSAPPGGGRDRRRIQIPMPPQAAAQLADIRARTGLKTPSCGVLLTAQQTGGAVATSDDRLRREAARLGLDVVAWS